MVLNTGFLPGQVAGAALEIKFPIGLAAKDIPVELSNPKALQT